MARSILRIGLCVLLLALAGCGDDDDDGGPPTCTADPALVPDVAGAYLVDQPSLGSSDCPSLIDDVIEDALAEASACVFTVGQDGARVTAVDCNDMGYEGCVDESGFTFLGASEQDSELGCTVRVDGELAATLTESPTAGTLTLDVRLSGTCPELDRRCTAVIDATVSEVVPEEGAATAGASPTSATVRLLSAAL